MLTSEGGYKYEYLWLTVDRNSSKGSRTFEVHLPDTDKNNDEENEEGDNDQANGGNHANDDN